MAKQPNISVRLVPFRVGMHPGMRVSFTILDFAAHDEETVVNVETPHRDALIRDDVEATSEFVESFTALEDISTPEEGMTGRHTFVGVDRLICQRRGG